MHFRECGGGSQAVPEVAEVAIALENRVNHRGVGLGPGGDSLRRNALEQALGLAEVDGDLPVEQLGHPHAERLFLSVVFGGDLIVGPPDEALAPDRQHRDRKSTRLNSSHSQISYADFCLKKKY